MYIFSTGIVDDIPESVEQLTKIINLPLSICIVYMKNKEFSEDEVDLVNLERKCKFLFERANRKFLKVIPYDKLGLETLGSSEAIGRMTESLPFEIESYFDSRLLYPD